MRGFSTIELLVSLMLFSSASIVALLVLYAAPQVLEQARRHHEALVLAERTLMNEERKMPEISDIRSYSTTTDDGYSLTFDALPLPDPTLKRLRSTVTWHEGERMRHTTLTSYAADYRTAGEYPCDLLPRRRWENLYVDQYPFVPGALLPADWSGGTVVPTRIKATRTLLALTRTSTASSSAPAFFLFAISDGTPVYRASLPVSSTTAATNDLALTHQYAYLASGSTCTDESRCGQLKIIDVREPSAPSLVGQLLLERRTPPYAGSASFATAAKSIEYIDGFVYLGLEETPTTDGQEFNVIDVHEPTHPIWTGGFRVGRTVNDIVVREGRAYLATNARGSADVLILDIHDPANITEIARISLPPIQPTSRFGYAHTLSLYDDELHVGRSYISNADEWVRIAVHDPTYSMQSSSNIGTVLTPRSVRALILRESQALLVTQRSIEVWSRVVPFSPLRITSASLPGDVMDATCAQNTLYALSNVDGVGTLLRISSL